jgi:hypothetical protein
MTAENIRHCDQFTGTSGPLTVKPWTTANIAITGSAVRLLPVSSTRIIKFKCAQRRASAARRIQSLH